MIETARLRGERLGPEHEAALCALLSDHQVGATLGGAQSPEGVRIGIARHGEHWDAHGFGYWMFLDRETGAPVGRGGLSRAHVGGRDEVEVGWAVMPERWGQGYATELGAASVRVAFDVLGVPDLVAYTLPDNLPSRRVMEKLGFTYEREVVHADLPHVLYRLRAPSPPARRDLPTRP